jgi:agmatine deiminase
MITKRLPADLGFHMPAEWEPHEATWLAWPHHRADWPGKFEAIPWVYAEIVRHLHRCEKVFILVNDSQAENRAKKVLAQVDLNWERIFFFRIPTDRVWTRDYAPIFVRNGRGELAAINWRFNGWAKYDNWKRDAAVGKKICEQMGCASWTPLAPSPLSPLPRGERGDGRVVLEGGSIDVNGAGTLLTTEECLLSRVQARNPGFKRRDYEKLFADYLGGRKVLWLGRGIAGDDTHGHVDDLARFVGPRTVVAAVENNSDDMNYKPLQENLNRLRGMTDQDGKPLEVVPLPMPAPVVFRCQRLPASYANFYIANDRVLVPTFNDPNDRQAMGILAELFPDREIIGIHAVDLVWGLGTLHCLTQQQAKGKVVSGQWTVDSKKQQLV